MAVFLGPSGLPLSNVSPENLTPELQRLLFLSRSGSRPSASSRIPEVAESGASRQELELFNTPVSGSSSLRRDMATPLAGLLDFTQAPNIGETELRVGDFTTPQLSPEVQRLVSESFAGPRDIATRGLRRTAESVAARRGLELFDTPVGEPFLRSQAELEERFASSEAQASLGLIGNLRNFLQGQAQARETARFGRSGLREGSLFNRSRLFEQGREFDENLQFSQEQFNELLRNQATQNQLALTQIAANLTTGLAGARGTGTTTTVNAGGFLDNLSGGLDLLKKGLGT